MTPMSTLAFAAGLSLALNACAQPAPSPATGTTPAPAAGSGALRVETVATGLEHPWSVALLPEGGFLVSERPGRLRRIGDPGQHMQFAHQPRGREMAEQQIVGAFVRIGHFDEDAP
mgnify:CR=1 FL=1